MTTVGWIGLGQMGIRMAPRLAAAADRVILWDRTPDKAEALRSQAVIPAGAMHDFNDAQAIVLMLRDHTATLEVFGSGLLDALRPGTLVIQMATVGRQEMVEEARILTARGLRCVEAPVAGSLGPAAAGELVVLCGGDEQDVDAALPLLRQLGHPRRLGPIGSANAAKLVINHLLGVTVAALAESYEMGQRLGIEAGALADLLQDLPTLSPAMRAKLSVMRTRNYAPTFYLELMQKDMGLVLAAGDDLHMAAAARDLYDKAAAQGHLRDDFAAVYEALRS